MLKVVKFGALAVVVAVLAYLSFFVEFGELTIYQHMSGIARTDEAKELGAQIEKKVDSTVDGISGEIGDKTSNLIARVNGDDTRPVSASRTKSKGNAGNEPSNDDRAALKKLILNKISN